MYPFFFVGLFELLIILVLLVVSGTSIVAWYYAKQETRDNAYAVILGRDVNKLTMLLEEDIARLKDVYEHEASITEQAKTRLTFFADRMRENTYKMKKYVGKQMQKLE